MTRADVAIHRDELTYSETIRICKQDMHNKIQGENSGTEHCLITGGWVLSSKYRMELDMFQSNATSRTKGS